MTHPVTSPAPRRERPVTDRLRQSVREDLPEIAGIADEALRARVVEAWAMAIAESQSFDRIADIPGEGNPGVLVLGRGDQTLHLRGVARLALAIADDLLEHFPEIELSRDIVLAGALCHDIGKAWECDPANQARWRERPDLVGRPSLRHSVYGAHLCLQAGLPEAIAHIALGHSLEGGHIGRSAECVIVHQADHAWWLSVAAVGMLQPGTADHLVPGIAPRPLREA
jgi:putative nucleotidyltransferase with HDIG domain